MNPLFLDACGGGNTYFPIFVQVYLVVGGWHIRTLDTTELLTSGAPRWQDSGKLPSARYGLRAATVDNKVVVTGTNQYGVNSVQLGSLTSQKILTRRRSLRGQSSPTSTGG